VTGRSNVAWPQVFDLQILQTESPEQLETRTFIVRRIFDEGQVHAATSQPNKIGPATPYDLGVSTLERRSTDRAGGSVLVFFDVERPVGIKVTAQVNSSELEDGLADGFGPAHSRTFHPILDEVLACTLDRATGDGP